MEFFHTFHVPALTARRLLVLGEGRYDPVVTKNPSEWSPRVFLGFPTTVHESLFNLCTGRGSWGGPDGTIPLPMRRAFCRFIEEGGQLTAPMAGTVNFTDGFAHIDGAATWRRIQPRTTP
jgi:hypothetical protein